MTHPTPAPVRRRKQQVRRRRRALTHHQGYRWRTVTIPASAEHDGRHLIQVTLAWVCPRCRGPRGEVVRAVSFDGSRRLECDGWTNPCGHVDYYESLRREADTATAEHTSRTTGGGAS